MAIVATVLLAAMPAAAQEAGDGFVCAGPDGDVSVTVGAVDRLSDVTGRAQDPDPAIVHVYMETADDFVEHAAFAAEALAGCRADPDTPFDDAAFEEAMGAWMEAARAGAPRYFTVSPGEAFGRAIEGDQG